MKTCAVCKKEKALACFNRRVASPDGKARLCRDCAREDNQSRGYIEKNQGIHSKEFYLNVDYSVEAFCYWCETTKILSQFNTAPSKTSGFSSYCRKCTIMVNHKLSYSRFLQMLTDQEDKCAICRVHFEVYAIDHDHRCCPGKRSCGRCIRGLLCTNCNTGIGCLKESKLVLTQAIHYLEVNDIL